MAADSKTEKATPKKRRDEKKKGNVFKSSDVISVVSLLGMFYAFKLFAPSMYHSIRQFLLNFIDYAGTQEAITNDFAHQSILELFVTFAKTALPLLLLSILFAVVPTIAQTRQLFASENLKPKFGRLNPLKGLKKMVSLKSLMELLKGLIKVIILFYLIYQFFVDNFLDFSKTIDMELIPSSLFIFDAIMDLVVKISIAYIAIAVFDYFYQWWDYERQLKMSKHEVKEEYKQTEGDPQIKGKIKEMQRKRAMSRMMQSVPDADVVIRNPTHFAVALKYDIDKDNAPLVVAKGQDELALRIVAVAEENGVTIVENQPLARAIYATADIGREIPAEFYGAVAEVLVYVYKLNNKKL